MESAIVFYCYRRRLRNPTERLLATLILALGLFSSTAEAAEQKNVLLICVDDLWPELASFGASYIHRSYENHSSE